MWSSKSDSSSPGSLIRRGGFAFIVSVAAASCAGANSKSPRYEETKLEAEAGHAESHQPRAGDKPTAAKGAWREVHASALIPVSSADPQWGEPLAPVTLVQFGDFECPFTRRVQPTIAGLKEKYGPSQLRVVWKHHPLPFHKAALPVHEASVGVLEEGGSRAFWRFTDEIFVPDNGDALTKENIDIWTKSVGVRPQSVARFTAMGHGLEKVEADIALARRLGLTGTPGFFINGIRVNGAQKVEIFQAAIDAEIEASRAFTQADYESGDAYLGRLRANFDAHAAAKKPMKKASPPDLTTWKLPVLKDDPVRGDTDALVTIIIFSDFQCPFCKRVQPVLEKVREQYGEDVRFVWKDNPLGFHKRALPAALAARAVYGAKGDVGFWKAHDAIFLSQPSLEDSDLETIVRGLGLSPGILRKGWARNQASKKIEESQELAMEFMARGTPTFFINGRRLKGAQPFSAFEKLIDEKLEEARAMVKAGTPASGVYEEIMKTGKEAPAPEKHEAPPVLHDAPYWGKKDASVVIQIFGDLECPFTRRVQGTLTQLKNARGGDIKLVWRHFPLKFHQKAQLAAEAAHEVYLQKGSGAFFEYTALVLERHGQINRATLEIFAEKLGVEMIAFGAALDSGSHKARIAADMKAARAAGVRSTPTFFVNDYIVKGAQPKMVFERVIRQAKNH